MKQIRASSAVVLSLSAVAMALFVVAAWHLRPELAAFLAAVFGITLGRLSLKVTAQATSLETSSESEELDPKTGGTPSAATLLEATMDGMREGVVIVNESMRIIASNPAVRSIFGRDPSAPEIHRLSGLTRNPVTNNAFRLALEKGERTEATVEHFGPDRRVFNLRVVPLRLDGSLNPRGAIGVFFDVTEVERLERVRQEFLSNVSHELRTPLTAIIASVETLEATASIKAADRKRFLEVIRKNGARMHSLVDDILELSAIESGGVVVRPQPVALRTLVSDVASSLGAITEARGVTIHNQVPGDAVVLADSRRMEQMLTNLIDNAIKFNRPGGEVSIAYERNARDRVSISDSGNGIPAEHLGRIFERFYRVDRARSRELGGTGLGLAIVKHLARAHGGEVTVKSLPNKGSVFTIELPRIDEPAPAESAASQVIQTLPR